jgi:hypothetical protein
MRTTIELPDELLTKARTVAVGEGISLKELFIQAIQQRLSPGPKKSRRPPPAIGGAGAKSIGTSTFKSRAKQAGKIKLGNAAVGRSGRIGSRSILCLGRFSYFSPRRKGAKNAIPSATVPGRSLGEAADQGAAVVVRGAIHVLAELGPGSLFSFLAKAKRRKERHTFQQRLSPGPKKSRRPPPAIGGLGAKSEEKTRNGILSTLSGGPMVTGAGNAAMPFAALAYWQSRSFSWYDSAMFLISLSLLVVPSLLDAQHNSLTPDERKAGWVLLFDGSDTSRWRGTASEGFPSYCWTVDDGCLRTRLGEKNSKREDLVSKDSFRDFEMKFDCRLTKAANTGVKYLVQNHIPLFNGHDYALGFEFQLIDNEGNPDARSSPDRQSGALYNHFPPRENAVRPVGEWNSGRIVLRDKAVEHWLNGVKVVEYRLDDVRFLESLKTVRGTTRGMVGWTKWDTPVSLQHHDGDVWFRDLKIRRLEAKK